MYQVSLYIILLANMMKRHIEHHEIYGVMVTSKMKIFAFYIVLKNFSSPNHVERDQLLLGEPDYSRPADGHA